MFGDEYQLLPVLLPGAITRYALRTGSKYDKPAKKDTNLQLLTVERHHHFLDKFTVNIFSLESKYCFKQGDISIDEVMKKLRIGHSSEEDAEYFTKHAFVNINDNDKFKK